jgi:hypothetical protein
MLWASFSKPYLVTLFGFQGKKFVFEYVLTFSFYFLGTHGAYQPDRPEEAVVSVSDHRYLR